MTNNTPDTPAASTSLSLSNRTLTSCQRSEAGVAHPYSTMIDGQSSEKTRELMVILLGLLQGFTEEVLSGDVVWFACSRAKDYAVCAGMDEVVVEDTIKQFMSIAKNNRSKNPMSGMF